LPIFVRATAAMADIMAVVLVAEDEEQVQILAEGIIPELASGQSVQSAPVFSNAGLAGVVALVGV